MPATGDADAYGALAARYETPLFSYAARMLASLGDGERCLVAAFANGWRDLQGGAAPSRPQPREWLYGLVRDECFDELARRPPTDSGDRDVGASGDCVELAAEAALRVQRPAHRDVLILRDVLGFDIPLLCVLLDMSEADAENLLYRARAEFGREFAAAARPRTLPRPPQRLPRLRRARASARDPAARAAAPRAAGSARARAPGAARSSQRLRLAAIALPAGARRRPCRASR